MDNLQERVEALEHHLQTLQAHTQTTERRLRWWRRLAWGLVVLSLVSLGQSSISAQEGRTLEGSRSLVPRLDDLGDTLRKLKKLLTHITIAKDDEGHLEIILSGVNLRIVNGLGSTSCDDLTTGEPISGCPNGLGNLIVGYNETRGGEGSTNFRTGSHNIIVGRFHNFSSYGGFAAGESHEISGIFATVCGGVANVASAQSATVCGGALNTAQNAYATVSGGDSNIASGNSSSVSGGSENIASGDSSSVSGGSNRTAANLFDWVAGSLFEDQ
jgi:hypothetical protein